MINTPSWAHSTSNYMTKQSQKYNILQGKDFSWPLGENTTSFPDFDISVLQEKFHEVVMQLVEEGRLQNIMALYEHFNQISLKNNRMNFVPSPKTLLFILNSLRFGKIQNWQIVRDLTYNLSAIDEETVRLRSRILSIISVLAREKEKDEELNMWLIDLVEDRL